MVTRIIPPHGRFRAWMLAAVLVSGPAAAQQQQGPDLAARVSKLEQSLSSGGLLEMLSEIEALKREVANLRGELENQAYLLEQQRRAQTAGYADIDARLRALSGGVPAVQGAAPPLAVLPATPSDAIAGAPAAQGNLQMEPAAPAAPPGAIDASAVPTPPPAASVPAIDPLTGQPIIPASMPTAPVAGQPPAPAVPGLPPAPLQAPQPVGGITPPAPAAPVVDDPAAEAAYQSAFTLLKSGEYDQAIAAFENFQGQYPNSQYGDNAQFWLAEAHYVKRDFAQALPAYELMLTRYPASRKLSHAMLKMGYSYAELGKPAEARAVLTDLQQRFPGSAAAQLAAQRLAQLPAAPR